MTTHPNETPEPLAGATVEACISALVSALQRDKGWLHDYADSVVRDAIDRKHLEPLAQGQAGEMPAPAAYILAWPSGRIGETREILNRTRIAADSIGCKASPLYTAEQMREYRAAALQAKDAEIARLKAKLRAREAGLFEARKLLDERPAINAGLFEAYSKWTGKVYSLDWLNAVDAAAIRAQTGGEG